MRTSILFVTCASLLGTVACGTSTGGDETTPKSREDYEDVAQSLGSSLASTAGGDTASFSDAVSLSRGVVPIGLDLEGNGQVGGLRLGFDLSYHVACRDAAGTAQATCDDRTDTADVTLDATGALDLPRLQAEVARSSSWRLADLTSPVTVIDGEGSFALDAVVMPADGTTRTYMLDLDAAYDGVLVRDTDQRAIGGTIGYQVDARRTIDGDVVASFTMDAEVTFQASGDAIVVLDGEHGFRIDTITGNVSDF